MVSQIIEQSYQLFGKYRVSIPLDVCIECCMKPEEAERLANLPVKEIPRDLLREYNDSAKPAKTRVEEIKHFLPRYLELISQFNFPSHSLELSFSRLSPFDFEEWKKKELALLRKFEVCFFKRALNQYPLSDFDYIDSVLILLEKDPFHLDVHLNYWENQKDLASLLHFRDLMLHRFGPYDPTQLSNPFANATLSKKVQSWLKSNPVKMAFSQSIETLIIETSTLNEKDAEELSIVYEMLIAG